MTPQRMIPINEGVSLHFRADAFNVFNHTQFSGTENTIDFTSLTNPTIKNLPYDSSGKLVNKFGVGAGSGMRSPRNLQLAAKSVFRKR